MRTQTLYSKNHEAMVKNNFKMGISLEMNSQYICSALDRPFPKEFFMSNIVSLLKAQVIVPASRSHTNSLEGKTTKVTLSSTVPKQYLTFFNFMVWGSSFNML